MQFQDFTNQYVISKTLKFELIPQGRTLEHIEAKGLLTEDEHRAESYKKVKDIIDRYHKQFIEEALSDFTLGGLDTYLEFYNIANKTTEDQKAFIAVQEAMRKSIVKHIKKHPKFSLLDKKELIRFELFDYCETEEEKAMVLEFQNFTTYFTGFNDNRKNMYSDEEKTTAIAYRIVHQNLPKFVDNLKTFDLLSEVLSEDINTMNNELQCVLSGRLVQDVFSLEFFNQTLTQKGIDRYNTVLGGFTDPEDSKKKIKGLNEYINQYNQKSPETGKIGKLKQLYKQILSDHESISFLPETLQNGQAVLDALRGYYENNLANVINEYGNTGKTLKEVLGHLSEYDLARIFIRNDASITDISQKMYGSWGTIHQALEARYDQTYTGKNAKKPEKYEEERKKYFKTIDSFSIESLNEALTYLEDDAKHKHVEKFFSGLGGEKNLITAVNDAYEDLEKLLGKPYPTDKELSQDNRNVEKIKTFLDSVKALQWFIKPLLGKGTEPNKDDRFYGDLLPLWNELDQITPLYNSIRNYMTKKPYSTEKIKLNFQNSTLLAGWDANQERTNTGLLFIKDGLYYLGIMDREHKKSFLELPPATSDDVYQKMEYKQLPGPEKMLPKVFFSKGRIDEFAPSEQVLKIYKDGTFKKGDDFKLEDCHALIDFYKKAIAQHPEWCQFNHQFSETSAYQNIGEFYNDVKQQGYKITYRDVPVEYMNQLIDEGKLYLFQIYNKDFSPYSKGIPNMHTLYWKMLFDERNLSDVVYKLNGEAEVFYRKASPGIKKTPTHPKNQMIANKNPLNPKKESVFEYDLIKNKRFTMDKFLFHVPLKLNFKANPITNLNMGVRTYLKEQGKTNIIGIHRGERNLLYVVVINVKGEILEHYSLNEIVNMTNGVVHKTDYHELLDRKEKEREAARKNWQTIENIKELKEGYLSQVVHKITQLMVKYQAIIVIEDLNMGFMQERQKVEKQVYQKFERMLISKLQYLVDKKAPVDQPGGLLKALQLTKNEDGRGKNSYEKQNGFLFYVPAWNTSNIDPTTGFVNLFKGSDLRYESINKSKAFINQMNGIRYNKTVKYFEFDIDYNNFTEKGQGTRTDWVICTHGKRIRSFRNADKNNQWDNEEVDVTQALRRLLDDNGIAYQSETLKEDILQMNSKAFFVEFLDLFRLTLQLRNRKENGDYLISPVKSESGGFFDSRDKKTGAPENEDANGAFNIARKGAWIVEAIKNAEEDKLNKVKMSMTNKEWLEYAQANLV